MQEKLSPLFAAFPIVNEPTENEAEIHFYIAERQLLGFDNGLFSQSFLLFMSHWRWFL